MSQLVIPINAPSTQLSLGITDASTVLQVASTVDFSPTGTLTLRTTGGYEIVTYTKVVDNTFTGLMRGTNRTNARAWNIGTAIFATEDMVTETEFTDRIKAIEQQLRKSGMNN